LRGGAGRGGCPRVGVGGGVKGLWFWEGGSRGAKVRGGERAKGEWDPDAKDHEDRGHTKKGGGSGGRGMSAVIGFEKVRGGVKRTFGAGRELKLSKTGGGA